MLDAIMLVACVGCAGFVSGLTGFAFALIASGTLLTIKPPIEATALVLICSMISQVIAIARLRMVPPRRTAAAMILPGLLGAPIGIYLLHDLDPNAIKMSIGVFLIAYAVFLACLNPNFHIKLDNVWADGSIGFVGGILGGIAGLAGALPTAWSLLREWDPRTKRAIYQSFTLVMQGWSLAILAIFGELPRSLAPDLFIAVPVVLVTVLIGLSMFTRINQKLFRSIVLAFLGMIGLTTIAMALPTFIR